MLSQRFLGALLNFRILGFDYYNQSFMTKVIFTVTISNCKIIFKRKVFEHVSWQWRFSNWNWSMKWDMRGTFFLKARLCKRNFETFQLKVKMLCTTTILSYPVWDTDVCILKWNARFAPHLSDPRKAYSVR